MPSPSVIGATIQFFGTLTFPGRPDTLWFDGIPLRDKFGNPLELPTVELTDGGTELEYDFQYNPMEVTNLTFTVRAVTLAEADGIVLGIRFNGQPVADRAGFDFMPPTSFPVTGQSLKAYVPGSERRTRESARDPAAQPVYRIDLQYRVEALRT